MCTYMNNAQSNTPVKRIHQVIDSIIVAKDLDRKLYGYI